MSRTLQGEPDAQLSAFGRTDADIEKDLRECILHEPLPRVNLPIAAGKIEKIGAESLVRAQRVSLKNTGAVSFGFRCGPIEPRTVVVGFVPARNETYGTAGEIRSLEFR